MLRYLLSLVQVTQAIQTKHASIFILNKDTQNIKRLLSDGCVPHSTCVFLLGIEFRGCSSRIAHILTPVYSRMLQPYSSYFDPRLLEDAAAV